MNATEEFSLLREMLEIDSPSGGEAPLAQHILRRASAAGLPCHIDAVGNTHVEIGSGTPHLLLLGHMDTVSGTWPVKIDGDMISARGAVDAKGALATFLCGVARLAKAPPARVTVVGAVQEETFGSLGARHVRDLYRPDAVIIGEPSGWDAVTIGYKGCSTIEYVVDTSVMHAAGVERPAVELATDVWYEVRSACVALSTGKSAFDAWLPRLLDISTQSNGLSQQTRLVIGIRTPRDDADVLESILTSACRLGTYRYLERTPAALFPKDGVLPRCFRVAIRSQGGSPAVKVKTGTSDMNVVAETWDVPMCAYGPGDAALDHTPHERLSLSEYQRSINVLVNVIERWANTVSRRIDGDDDKKA